MIKNISIITIPYFYIIQHKPSKKLYCGARWKNGCNPQEFMTLDGYKTSSKIINDIIKNDGLDAFEILRIDTNLDGYPAKEYERVFIAVHGCRLLENWYNKPAKIKKETLPKIKNDKQSALPSQEYLLECFDYDKDTGIVIWKNRPLHHFHNIKSMKRFNTIYSGKIICNTNSGYIRLKLNKESYYLQRIIWKMVTGNDPKGVIDHIDNDKTNNKWDNLRETSQSNNSKNREKSKNNTSGFKGVSYHKNNGMYMAHIGYNYRKINLGYFNTKEEAYKAYCDAALRYHGKYANFK